ncbi:unnamed protein product [Dovyalis caffra]|uniref:Uncharacterized protein n=1 Tax=Dovyalis caffra TaxID=77055 RepID=A0AAV1STD0_9ROSI|nr:unnamed protein product [Dovyalis caffra]
MTNCTEDTEDGSEERNPGDEVRHVIDLDVSSFKRLKDELKALRMQLSKRKGLKLSKERLNLSTNEYGYGDGHDGQELNGFDHSKRLNFVINGSCQLVLTGLALEYSLTCFTLGCVSTDYHLSMDDSDGDDDSRACFPCPFCYVEIEVHVLCSHLQDEHCFDLKNAVCPLCAANLGKDAIGHFIVQHASLLKLKRKHKKSGLRTGSSAMLGKDLSSFLGSPTNSRINTHESAPDPLLSPFFGNLSLSHPKRSQPDEPSNKSASVTSHSKSYGMSSFNGVGQVDCEEQRQKARFVQQLIASTIF